MAENHLRPATDAIAAAARRRTAARRRRAGEPAPIARSELKRRILAAWGAPTERHRLADLAALAWPRWTFASAQGAALAVSPIAGEMLRTDRTVILHREGTGANRYGLSDRGLAQMRSAEHTQGAGHTGR